MFDKIRFHLDENVPLAVAQELRKRGINAPNFLTSYFNFVSVTNQSLMTNMMDKNNIIKFHFKMISFRVTEKFPSPKTR